jgi:Protein of unknown function (DUF1003)
MWLPRSTRTIPCAEATFEVGAVEPIGEPVGRRPRLPGAETGTRLARADRGGVALLGASARLCGAVVHSQEDVDVTSLDPAVPHHPVVVAHTAHRAADAQLRIADAITAFAGSMPFVYIHALLFALWMVFVEADPWPKLTLVVSLEAIFLSTFVMIGQNRQASFQRAKADHDFVEQEQELKSNTDLTRAIHVLTAEIHRRVVTSPPVDGGRES